MVYRLVIINIRNVVKILKNSDISVYSLFISVYNLEEIISVIWFRKVNFSFDIIGVL